MRFLHISDLHLGKKIHGFSMIDDQEYILQQILTSVEEDNVDGLIIAGDIYDTKNPPNEAVGLFDYFLTELSKMNCHVYAIAGNHDSAERMDFGRMIFQKDNIHFIGNFTGKIEKIEQNKNYEKVNIFLLPFIKPSIVRPFFPESEVNTYDDAFLCVLSTSDVNESECNILVAHQFVTGSGIELMASESEEVKLSVGGLNSMAASNLSIFDYVALGHIHRPQTVGRSTIRYCGSPLKYSASEILDEKSITVIDTNKKSIVISTIPLKPLRDMREIKGTIEELTSPEAHGQGNTDDYIFAVVTEEIMDAKAKLNVIYPNVMDLKLLGEFRFGETEVSAAEMSKLKLLSPEELFVGFFEEINGRQMKPGEHEIFKKAMDIVFREEL